MSSRDVIMGSIRRSLGVTGREAPRRQAVADRLADHPRGLIPERGRKQTPERLAVFRQMGIRTRMEIEAERYALKGLRGDFRGLQGPAPSRAARAERALQAIRA